MANDQNSSMLSSETNTVTFGATLQLWSRRLFDCNPFYPISALLLPYSIYAISVGPSFLESETAQIVFNFSALQIYSLMLVFTAIFLAKRFIWYDATLLVVLENILIWVPFMLVSHAAFMEGGLARTLCWFGAILAVLKIGCFRGLFSELRLPGSLLAAGLLILGLNVFLPLAFRAGLEFADGAWTNNELWRSRSLFCWYVALPALALLGLALPVGDSNRGPFGPHRKLWLPVLLFSLWITASAVHLYSIGYVDDQKFTPSKFIPLLWALSWVFCFRVLPHVAPIRQLQLATLTLPAAIPIVSAFINPPEVAIALLLMNSAFFGWLAWRGLSRKFLLWLSAASLFGAFLAVPNEWMVHLIQGYGKTHVILALAAGAALAYSIRTRTARAALLGSISLLLAISAFGNSPAAFTIAAQAALIYALLHSLWWQQPLGKGSGVFRALLITGWILHSILLQFDSPVRTTYLPLIAGALFALLLLAAKLFAHRFSPILAAAAGLVIMVKPGVKIAVMFRHAPYGLLPLVASFLLFGLGTLFALKRRRVSTTPAT